MTGGALGAVTWRICDRSELPGSLGWLAADERARLDGMRIAKRRADYVLGRWAAKQALGARLASVPRLEAIAIRAAGDGAPEAFLDGAPLALTVSISHSAGRALAAVCERGALGADLERVEPRSQLLVDDFFTADEAAQLAARPAAERDHAITLIWSAKEAALKARRSGLRDDPRRMRVTLGSDPTAPDCAWRALEIAVDHAPAGLAGWWRDDAGFVVTIVSDAAPARFCP